MFVLPLLLSKVGLAQPPNSSESATTPSETSLNSGLRRFHSSSFDLSKSLSLSPNNTSLSQIDIAFIPNSPTELTKVLQGVPFLRTGLNEHWLSNTNYNYSYAYEKQLNRSWGSSNGVSRETSSTPLVAGLLDDVLCGIGFRRSVTAFRPLPKFRDAKGFLTDGKYKVDRAAMLPHETGSLASGKSQFLSKFTGEAADNLILDSAELADQLCLWTGTGEFPFRAKVEIVNEPIGVVAGTGQLTHWLNVYRTTTNFVHGSPGNPP